MHATLQYEIFFYKLSQRGNIALEEFTKGYIMKTRRKRNVLRNMRL